MRISVNGEIKTITVKTWLGENYTPDYSNDLLAAWHIDKQYDRDDDAWISTEEEYDELVEWLNGEIKAHNAGEESELFASSNDEIVAFYD